jgi:hypothetical protein
MKKAFRHIGPLLFATLLAWIPATALASRGALPELDWGCIASHDTSPDGSSRSRALGPFFEKQDGTNGTDFLAVRPLYDKVDEPQEHRSLQELLWPVCTYKVHDDETYGSCLVSSWQDFGNTNAQSAHRFTLLPFVYSGRDKSNENYFAIFPLGGKINDFFWQDRITFVLFPLYCSSRVNDVQRYDVLWPFITWAKGGGKRKFSVLPFYLRSVNDGKWDKTSILWPIWTSVKYMYPEENGGGFILFPLFGHIKVTGQETWMVAPPLFRWSKGKTIREVNCPWPFFQYSAGETDKLYLWPLWGEKRMKSETSWFMLLNLISGGEIDRSDYKVDRFMIFPLVFSESRTMKETASQHSAFTNDATFARYFKLWPLMSYRREGDTTRWRTLDLWPTKDMAPAERNLAPFWTIYSHTRVDDIKEDEFLWGLFRWQRGGGAAYVSLFPLFSTGRAETDNGDIREWSFLKGLIGYKREGLRKKYRLLYFITF